MSQVKWLLKSIRRNCAWHGRKYYGGMIAGIPLGFLIGLVVMGYAVERDLMDNHFFMPTMYVVTFLAVILLMGLESWVTGKVPQDEKAPPTRWQRTDIWVAIVFIAFVAAVLIAIWVSVS